MSSGGLFKASNTSKHQKERALSSFKKKIDLSKVNLPHFNIYLARKITAFLDGFDDDVTIAMVQNSLAAGLNSSELQDVLEPIIGLANAKELVIELYDLLTEASKTSDGIPPLWKEGSTKSIISSQSLSQDHGFIEALKKAKAIATVISTKDDDKIKLANFFSSNNKRERELDESLSTTKQKDVEIWIAPEKKKIVSEKE